MERALSLQTKKLDQNQMGQHPDIGLLSLQNCKKYISVELPVYDVFVIGLKWLKTIFFSGTRVGIEAD